jgi:hypothetical protein
MRKLTSGDLRELNLLKHYRIIRKWACKTNGPVRTHIAGITGAGTDC